MTLLFLNNVGTGEVVFIMFIVLMLFGSKSIPTLARGLGKGMREIRNASSEIKRDIQNSTLEMRRDFNTEQALKEIEEYKIETPEIETPEIVEPTDKRGDA